MQRETAERLPGQDHSLEQARAKSRALPFSREQIEAVTAEYPTPFYLYSERGMRESARRLRNAFSWVEGGGFRNHFAVKALPNPHILEILNEEGQGADCSSYTELLLAQAAGISGDKIMFTSNDTPAEEFVLAKELGAIINLDDIGHVRFLEQQAGGLPPVLGFRYNPGPLRSGSALIGKPEEVKFGLTREQMIDAYLITQTKGVRRFGMHTMLASDERNAEYFVDTARMLFDLAGEIYDQHGIKMDYINLGGGIGIPYKPGQEPVDIDRVSEGIREAYEEQIKGKGLDPVRIVMECGRYVTGPHGVLVTKVRHLKSTYRDHVGVDASMTDLKRPGTLGAYHHLTVLGKEDEPYDQVYDVTGSLCVGKDRFAEQRPLPKMEPGDLVVIHDAGAHAHSSGYNYNGKLRTAELLVKEDGSVQQIRRAETPNIHFSTLDYPGLKGVQ